MVAPVAAALDREGQWECDGALIKEPREGGDKCRTLKNEIDVLLYRIADITRATAAHADGSTGGVTKGRTPTSP